MNSDNRQRLVTSHWADIAVVAICLTATLILIFNSKRDVDNFSYLGFAVCLFGALSYTKCLLYGERIHVHVFKFDKESAVARIFFTVLMWFFSLCALSLIVGII